MIEIDQNLPEGMPRAVIFRGTRKQINAAKKLVEGLVLRAKADEKTAAGTAGPPVAGGAGMGILGRGPAGLGDEKPKDKEVERGEKRIEAAPPAEGVAGAAGSAAALPPWRRTKGEEEAAGRPLEPRGPVGRGGILGR